MHASNGPASAAKGPARAGAAAATGVPALSAEIFVIPLAPQEPGRYLIYAPLRQAAFVTNATVVNFMADLKQGVFDSACDPDGSLVEFLTRLEMIGAGPERMPVTTPEGDPAPTSVTLFLTTACNLRCTYCYASAGETPIRSMPLSVARRGIDFVLENAVRQGTRSIEIAYHGGGEPTLNWRTLTDSLAYARDHARRHRIRVVASCATNGVLSDRQISWIIANLDGLSLSIDGLPEAHDRHRRLPSGKGSSDRVAHTLRRLDAAGFPYGLRLTVTADQIATLPDSIEYLCANFSATRIQVEPAYPLGRWADAPSAETTAFVSVYRMAQARAHCHGRQIYYSAARVGHLTNHFCGVTQDAFALSPDGNVSACYEVFSEQSPWAGVFFYGRPGSGQSGYVFDRARIEHLRRQAVQHRDYCRGCYARWTCAGDCLHRALDASNGREFRGTDRCHITRELTRDQILARIAAAGGVFWHEATAPGTPTASGSEVSP